MGINQSNQSNINTDLKKPTSECFGKTIIMLPINPIYILNNDEYETNLDTGDDELNNLVNDRISKLGKYLGNLLNKHFKYEICATEINEQKIYITMEKHDKSSFEIGDCKNICEFFDSYNNGKDKLTIIKEREACSSLFFDDIGDIKLGFIIDPIEYL